MGSLVGFDDGKNVGFLDGCDVGDFEGSQIFKNECSYFKARPADDLHENLKIIPKRRLYANAMIIPVLLRNRIDCFLDHAIKSLIYKKLQ